MFKSRARKIFAHDDVNPWLLVLIFTTVLSSPVGVLNKLLLTALDPFVITTVRYFIVVLVLLPISIRYFRRYKEALKKKLKWILFFGAIASLGVPAHMVALSMTSVSFIAILDLLVPILFVIISTLATKDKLSRNAFVGISFALLGGSVMLLLPAIFNWPGVNGFGLLPVLLMAISMIIAASSPVVLRKLNTNDLPLVPILTIFYMVAFVISGILSLTVHGPGSFESLITLPSWAWIIVFSQAVLLSAIFRWLNIKAYENLGTATTASVDYLYYALAVCLPLLLLGERLPPEVIIGGLLIVVGIVFVRRHPHKRMHRPHRRV